MQIAAESTTFLSLRSTAISASSAASTYSRFSQPGVHRRNRGGGWLQVPEGFDGCSQIGSRHRRGQGAAYRDIDSIRYSVAGAEQPISISERNDRPGEAA